MKIMKEKMILALDKIIQGLTEIKTKIINGEPVTNEDWINCAAPLRASIELFMNQKHLLNK